MTFTSLKGQFWKKLNKCYRHPIWTDSSVFDGQLYNIPTLILFLNSSSKLTPDLCYNHLKKTHKNPINCSWNFPQTPKFLSAVNVWDCTHKQKVVLQNIPRVLILLACKLWPSVRWDTSTKLLEFVLKVALFGLRVWFMSLKITLIYGHSCNAGTVLDNNCITIAP